MHAVNTDSGHEHQPYMCYASNDDYLSSLTYITHH